MPCDNLEGWDGVGWGGPGGRLKREEMYLYLWLIHVVVQQKPTQRYKAIILQLKNKVSSLSLLLWVTVSVMTFIVESHEILTIHNVF